MTGERDIGGPATLEQRPERWQNPEKLIRDKLYTSMSEVAREHLGLTGDSEAALRLGDNAAHPEVTEYPVLIIKEGYKGYGGMDMDRQHWSSKRGRLGMFSHRIAVDTTTGEIICLQNYWSKVDEAESYKDQVIEGPDALLYTVGVLGIDEEAFLQEWKDDLEAAHPTRQS
jgi:hypothetical protein